MNSKLYGKIQLSEDAHGLNGNGTSEHKAEGFSALGGSAGSPQGGDGTAPRIERSAGRWEIKPGELLIPQDELKRRIEEKIDESLELLGAEVKAIVHQAVIQPLDAHGKRIARLTLR